MKKLRIIALLSLVMVCSIVMAGCSNSSNNGNGYPINFKVGTSGISHGSADYGAVLIRNHTQLKAAFDDAAIVWLDNKPIWERYDAGFFAAYALVVYAFGVSGDYAPEFSVEEITREGATLNVNLVQHGMTAGLAYFSVTILIEVSQSDVANVSTVKIDLTIE